MPGSPRTHRVVPRPSALRLSSPSARPSSTCRPTRSAAGLAGAVVGGPRRASSARLERRASMRARWGAAQAASGSSGSSSPGWRARSAAAASRSLLRSAAAPSSRKCCTSVSTSTDRRTTPPRSWSTPRSPRAVRTWVAALWSWAAAASGSRSGHRRSRQASRASRWPGASARMATSCRDRRERQSPGSTSRPSIRAAKPPSRSSQSCAIRPAYQPRQKQSVAAPATSSSIIGPDPENLCAGHQGLGGVAAALRTRRA